MNRISSLMSLVLVTALALAACGGVATQHAEIAGAQWRIFVQEGQSGSARSAGLEGNLHFDAATGCVYLQNGESSLTVVWPEGTELGRDALVITLLDGTIVPDGAMVLASGGSEAEPDLLVQCPGSFPGVEEIFVIDFAQPGG